MVNSTPTRLRHLITLDGLDRSTLSRLLDSAAHLREQFGREHRCPPLLANRTMVNLFFETSTRTRSSFELAARRLGAHVLNFDITQSSAGKGETLEDTLATLEAMSADAFVVRQGLLDALTIRDRLGRIDGAVVAICGDIRHSRVARSDVHALRVFGAGEIRLCGPSTLLPDATDEFPDCILTDDFDAAIAGADVLIMLRLQRERMKAGLIADDADYFRRYGLDVARLRRASPDAIVMHPGPMNRGVEISDDVADGRQSAVLDQVANGVFVRMAVLVELIGES